jgi:hypothetical protein
MDCVTSGNEQKQTVCQDIAFCESASQREGYEPRFFASGSALRELCSILGRARFGFDIVSPREGREAYVRSAGPQRRARRQLQGIVGVPSVSRIAASGDAL